MAPTPAMLGLKAPFAGSVLSDGPTATQLVPSNRLTKTCSAGASSSSQATYGTPAIAVMRGSVASLVASTFSEPPTDTQLVPLNRFTYTWRAELPSNQVT